MSPCSSCTRSRTRSPATVLSRSAIMPRPVIEYRVWVLPARTPSKAANFDLGQSGLNRKPHLTTDQVCTQSLPSLHPVSPQSAPSLCPVCTQSLPSLHPVSTCASWPDGDDAGTVEWYLGFRQRSQCFLRLGLKALLLILHNSRVLRNILVHWGWSGEHVPRWLGALDDGCVAPTAEEPSELSSLRVELNRVCQHCLAIGKQASITWLVVQSSWSGRKARCSRPSEGCKITPCHRCQVLTPVLSLCRGG